MCNLYTVNKDANQVAARFRAKIRESNVSAGEVYPGGYGMVIREEHGERVLQGMTWGFPVRLKGMKPEAKPKPVNNIANLDSFTWRFIAPLTGFCEAEGPKGGKCRTWLSVNDQPLFAWAGMWTDSKEWGPVYSGLMTDCNEAIRPIHTRMPVLLHEEDHDRWLHGSLSDVIAFRDRCFPDELIEINRTDRPWNKRSAAAA
jgi:putative SOS response-associated peptidase YedK